MAAAVHSNTRLDRGFVLDGRYEIVEEIGEGAMGVVYKATHEGIERLCAIKMLNESRTADAESLRRFQREAQVISTLNHKNIVRVYSVGMAESHRPYFVMDYLEGLTLADLLIESRKDSKERYLKIFIQCCDALAHAHAHNVIHRDVKPSNIVLVDDDGEKDRVKLVDFGIARWLDPESQMQKLTRTGFLVGSPVYMSPEQCLAAPPDPRSDIYALACIMYQIITGTTPFTDETPTRILYKHITEPVPPFSSFDRLRMPVGEDFEKVVMKGLAKKPEHRYQSMEDLKADLLCLLEGKPPVNLKKNGVCAQNQTTLSMPVYKAPKKMIAATLAAVAMMFLAAGWVIWNNYVIEQDYKQRKQWEAKAIEHWNIAENTCSETTLFFKFGASTKKECQSYCRRAVPHFEQAYQLANKAGNDYMAARILFSHAQMVRRRLKDSPTANDLLKKAYEHGKTGLRNRADILNDIEASYVETLMDLHNYKEAKVHADNSCRYISSVWLMFRKEDSELCIARKFEDVLENQIGICEKLKMPEQADKYFRMLLELQMQSGMEDLILAETVEKYSRFMDKQKKSDMAAEAKELALQLKRGNGNSSDALRKLIGEPVLQVIVSSLRPQSGQRTL